MAYDGISIGKDKYIEWIEIYPKDEPYEIDELLTPTLSFWKALETECVVVCCGIDALGLWPEDVIKAAEPYAKDSLLCELSLLKANIVGIDNDIIVCHRLNNLFHKSVFIKLLDHIIGCINPSTSQVPASSQP